MRQAFSLQYGLVAMNPGRCPGMEQHKIPTPSGSAGMRQAVGLTWMRQLGVIMDEAGLWRDPLLWVTADFQSCLCVFVGLR